MVTQGMGRLRDLVGQIEPMAKTIIVYPGHVLVVLKNGRPVRALPPGKHTWWNLKLPATGTLMKVLVSTEEVVLHAAVDNIATACEYAIPRIEFQVGFRIDDTTGYDSLLNYIATRGLNIGEMLEPELVQEFDHLARWVIRQSTHAQLYGMGNIQPLFVHQTNTPFLHGLFVLTRVITAVPTWNPEFLAIQEMESKQRLQLEDIRRTGEIEHARKLAELLHRSADGQLSMQEDEQLLEHAARLGLDAGQLTNPELALQREQMRADLAAELIRNVRDIRGGDPVVVQALLASLGSVGPAPSVHSPPPHSPPPGAYRDPMLVDPVVGQLPAAPPPPPPGTPPPGHSAPSGHIPPPPPSGAAPVIDVPSAPAPPGHAAPPPPPDVAPPHVPPPPGAASLVAGSGPAVVTPQLRVDPDVRASLEAVAGRLDEQWGAAMARSMGRTVLLVVAPPHRANGLDAALRSHLGPTLGLGGDVIVIAYQPVLRRIVADYLVQRLQHQISVEAVVDVQVQGARLTVVVDQGDRRFAPIHRQIVAPEALVLGLLEAVLPYEAIDVVAARPE